MIKKSQIISVLKEIEGEIKSKCKLDMECSPESFNYVMKLLNTNKEILTDWRKIDDLLTKEQYRSVDRGADHSTWNMLLTAKNVIRSHYTFEECCRSIHGTVLKYGTDCKMPRVTPSGREKWVNATIVGVDRNNFTVNISTEGSNQNYIMDYDIIKIGEVEEKIEYEQLTLF